MLIALLTWQVLLGAAVALGLVAYLRAAQVESSTINGTSPASRSKSVNEILAEHELLTNNIAAAVIIRKLDGGISFCSPYTEVLTGYPVEDVLEHNGDFFETIVLDEDRERYRRAIMVSELGEDYLVRFRIRHRSGIKLWLESRMVPILDHDGNVQAVMGVTIDVTDTLNSQKKIEQQNRDLSDFSYMVSHDLKSPVFTIKGMATALSEDYGPQLNDDARQLLKFILDGAGRLESLVGSILQYTMISSAEHEEREVPLQEVIANVISDLGEQIRERKALVSVSAGLPKVMGHEIQLYQLFSNLIGNALKYSSPERIPEIFVSAKEIGLDTVVVEVRDNGLGIPSNKLGEVFRPFHRAHGGEIEGNGIGLACVKKIVERHGGRISIQSEVGAGTSFFVELPLAVPSVKADSDDLVRCFERP